MTENEGSACDLPAFSMVSRPPDKPPTCWGCNMDVERMHAILSTSSAASEAGTAQLQPQ